MSQAPQESISFLKSPTTGGFGYSITPTGKHIKSQHADQSLIGFVENDLVYWGSTVTTSAIAEHAVEKLINRLINVLLIVVVIGGIIAVGFAAVVEFNVLNNPGEIITVVSTQHPRVLLFWLAVTAAMVLYYRMQRLIETAPHIEATNKLAKFVPSGDIRDWHYWVEQVGNEYKTDASEFVTAAAQDAINRSYQVAKKMGHHEIRPIHLLLSLVEASTVRTMLYRLEIDKEPLLAAFRRIASKHHELSEHTSTSIDFGADIRRSLLNAYAEARTHNRPAIGEVELLMGCVLSDEMIRNAMYDREVDIDKVRGMVAWTNIVEETVQHEKMRRKLARSKPKKGANKAMTSKPTRGLDAISQDFTVKARYNAFMPPIGRDNEVESAFRVLREGHSSVLLVGESGVGKTTIVEGIANLMSAEDVPESLQDLRLVVTDPGTLVAGAVGPGAIEGRMQQILNEITAAGNILWVIEDIHSLLGAGSTGSSIDIGKMVMNFVSQGYVRVIGTTTTPEFQQYIEPYEPFRRRFQIVNVPELDHPATINVLQGRSPYIEGKHSVFFTYDALQACVELSDRFIKELHLPAKAIDLMDEAALYARDKRGENTLVVKADVEQVISQKTNVEVSAIGGAEADKLLHMEEILHKRVVGQSEALEAIAKALRRARNDLRDLGRPIATLLFMGPTGVGKTETAKAIAETYFGNEETMMRFDMSEYDTAESITKLIGGKGEEGTLTEAVRRTPFGIVLLDEFKKAHSDVRNIFLQVMEDGRLTDGQGRVADFTNVMLIATSNAGTDNIQKLFAEGHSSNAITEELLNGDLLKGSFKPELLNRFDDIIVFTPLTEAELNKICELLLGSLAKQMENKGITLRWTPEAVAYLAHEGYDPVFGARPLRRVIQDTTQDAIAKLLLENKIGRRDIVELQDKGEVVVIKAERI